MRDKEHHMHPRVVIVMGVSGVGKSAVGRLLAAQLGAAFHDADDFHPPANVERMRAGLPLTDDHRAPWLAALRGLVETILAGPDRAAIVLACSALKRAYRQRLGSGLPGVRLVHLDGDPELIRRRIAARRDHFMPASLLDSQLATLERPGGDEHPIVVDVAHTPDAIVATILRELAC
ncbi:MAG: gluconokinase [Planctomycetes bacterium]|nr:gluconokinase [Planctomycetota bacterium]